ncbi:hypothetical protein [Campylobacter pinnipediorum]|uniref:Uncharacterized protein n=1 Tax=Campylobacter pinnipediorum subsp. pinnipediorum TaxID=1660067 RepID=A0AAX0LAR7_9BACT|nr:hypothetical protein [Campylobacter pinnipediorum]AQW81375.1 hypothetical protein CPIN17260_1086 [Campylobacter pinnipediorum subsp. pinnipediorum]AQW83001.1 hypothetical protein CPIN17261_0997 [Campylobacter pinnipediorum subsp. pinnipediorum]OPA77342.1 hypothetical protein BFG04_04405 [Campylobacter pinnipediorum subsp. pinnipediorum]
MAKSVKKPEEVEVKKQVGSVEPVEFRLEDYETKTDELGDETGKAKGQAKQMEQEHKEVKEQVIKHKTTVSDFIRADELDKDKAKAMLELISKGIYFRKVVKASQEIVGVYESGGVNDESLKAINDFNTDEFIQKLNSYFVSDLKALRDDE